MHQILTLLNSQAETSQLQLGLEPMGQDSDSAKTQTGTWTHMVVFEHSQNPRYLVSGPNETQVLIASLQQKKFSERQSDR